MGYLRARRSVRLGPGVKLNLTKRGMSVNVGGRGAHYTVSTTGRKTRTVGIPGTGISYVDSHGGRASRSGGGGRSRASSRPARVVPVARARPRKPGLFAPAREKRFYTGVSEYMAGRPEQGPTSARRAIAISRTARAPMSSCAACCC